MNSEVTVTKMDPEEQKKRQKRSPAFYIECREKGMLDKEIAKEMGVKAAYLSQLKGRWDFIGKSIPEMHNKLKTESKKSRIKNGQEPKQGKKPVEEIKADPIKGESTNLVMKADRKEIDKSTQVLEDNLEKAIKERDHAVKRAKQEYSDRMEADKEVDKLEARNKELKTSNKDLEEIIATKEKSIEHMKAEHDDLMKKYEELNEQYAALEAESSPKQTVSELNRQLDQVVGHNEQLREEIRNLRNQLHAEIERANYHGKRDQHLWELLKLG